MSLVYISILYHEQALIVTVAHVDETMLGKELVLGHAIQCRYEI